ncbi:MFS transporter [Mongoliitalea daihaiensis]|uniref:MFS transporter n=1 Tax=Mongoliitalea daihaiensis TaxID=2782006 RepID=UPI001F4616BF|nr:MFS transporter [Mongoliitalea daihaiensis]UJP64837.1 MFS transporter [Mongoliitalea daihaiensis]
MKNYFTIIASFVIMLCLGSLYAWSVIANELVKDYGFTIGQAQLIFGVLIAVFPLTMVFVGQLDQKLSHKYLGVLSGVLFLFGYLTGGLSQGNFFLVLIGIGFFGGMATGFGYWVALNASVRWFPEKKGLVTGIATAGFGLGAMVMSLVIEYLLNQGFLIFDILILFALSYGSIVIGMSFLIYQNPIKTDAQMEQLKVAMVIRTRLFQKLFFGLSLGTFAGLLIIGSLKLIGSEQGVSLQVLVLSVSLFAIANFLGRLVWGFVSDYIGASLSIFLALLVQGISIFFLNFMEHSDFSFLIVVLLIGFGFGGNFVLFAKETAHVYGIQNLGLIYPFVFLGKTLAGISGPLVGGFLYDLSASFYYPIMFASAISVIGSLLFLHHYLTSRRLSG